MSVRSFLSSLHVHVFLLVSVSDVFCCSCLLKLGAVWKEQDLALKVSLPLPAEEKPFQPQPDSDDETGQSPANSFAASSSSSVSSTLSVGELML